MASELESKIEAIDAVVKTFSNSLNDFVKVTNDSLKSVAGSVASLGDCWSGSLYNSFRAKMDKQTGTIAASIKRGEELQKRLDSISNEFANALAMLKASGSNNS